MPQVDLEALVCGGGGDGRVSCETLIGVGEPAAAARDPDLTAESFRLRIGDEIGWVDVNAVYDRDDSTKGNTNPKSQQHAGHQTQPWSISQRFSGGLVAKAPIIGLPNKIQHSSYLAHCSRRPPKGRIFPKGGRRKAALPESEPASPKVSCIGKVLSERERDRCRRLRQGPPEASKREERVGFWANLVAFFRCGGGERAAAVECVDEKSSPAPSASIPAGMLPRSSTAEPAMATPPGLAGMKRFSSCRRSASWGGNVDAESEGHVGWSGSLDREEMWGRRSVGSLEDAVRRRLLV